MRKEGEVSLKGIKAALEAIQERVRYILKEIENAEEQRSACWRCTGCGYTKHFTRPVTRHVAPPCPKCRGQAFGVANRE